MWLYLKTYLCFLTALHLIYHVNCEQPLVEISQGTLRGRTATNRDGGMFYSFQSIPYGQPPINELRFKAPTPAAGWEGIRDATRDLPTCWQFSISQGGFTGQEDCLYLNVFTPQLPSENYVGKPVMVFIHGGGFIRGSAQTTTYGPEFLLTKDIVLVTINYRVGIFGFLNLDDPELEVPGNAGMKDQVLALRWVKDNIERFGGDPDNISIFGESAGSASVHLQMLSPMSSGLFNRVIAQSGVALMKLVDGTRNSGEVLAQELGIQTEIWSEMLTTLREVSPENLMTATQIISLRDGQFTTPIVEEPSKESAFLPNRPIDIIQSGDYNQVTLLLGVNNAEGLLFQMNALQSTGESMLIEDFTNFIPREFEITSGSDEEAVISQKIKEFYYGDSEPTREDIGPAVALYGDTEFGFPAYRSVLEHLETLSAPIYFYWFSADTVLNFLKQEEPRLQAYPGASHADDIGYLFHTIFTPSTLEEGGVEDLAWRNMVNLWSNFATYGNPTPDGSAGLAWQPVTENTFNFLHIGTDEIYSDVNPNAENMQFWNDLYQEYYPQN